jgi:hypothetical protein
MREKSHGGALPVWSGREAVPVWWDIALKISRCGGGQESFMVIV